MLSVMNDVLTPTIWTHLGAPPRRRSLGAMLVRAARDTAYLTIGLATSILAFGVWVAGLTLSLTLAAFIVGLPIVLLTAVAFRWTAELDRRNAALVRGGALRGRYRDHRGQRFLARVGSTLADPQTWKDLEWLDDQGGGVGPAIDPAEGAHHAVDEQRRPAELGDDLASMRLVDDARAVGVGDEDVVELGQEARGRRRVGVGKRGFGHVEELAT